MPNRRVTILNKDIVSRKRMYILINSNFKTSTRNFNAYIYSAGQRGPSSVKVHTYLEEGPGRSIQSPAVEALLGESRLQPYVHDCTIVINIGQRAYNYLVFFKNHRRLNHNKAVFNSCRENFRGDLLVMLLDSSDPSRLSSMRSGDLRRFDSVLSR